MTVSPLIEQSAVRIAPAPPEAPGFDALVESSRAEGFFMLARLQEEWASGGNSFSRRGEPLVGASEDGGLVGLCGRTVDPYANGHRVGRLRRLFVHPGWRGQGIGALLVRAVVDGAVHFFDRLDLRAPDAAFGFYERLNFQPVREAHATHRLALDRRPRPPA